MPPPPAAHRSVVVVFIYRVLKRRGKQEIKYHSGERVKSIFVTAHSFYYYLQDVYCDQDMLSTHTLEWRHNGHNGVSNHQPHQCLLNRLLRRRSKKTSKLRVTDLCAGNSPVTGEVPARMASNAENVSIWWRHHDRPSRSSSVHTLVIASQSIMLPRNS